MFVVASYIDECGTCDSDILNDCIQDCEGTWGGDVQFDCLGDCGGDALLDDCGICNGGNESFDCNDMCTGDLSAGSWYNENAGTANTIINGSGLNWSYQIVS